MEGNFPNPITKLLGGPLRDVIDSVGGVIDKVTTTDAERLAAQRELAQIEREYQAKLVEADVEWAKAQAEVIVAETKADSWLARSWRPILMLSFGAILLYSFIAAPLFGAPSVPLPVDLWDLLKIGVGGYILGRSSEKIAPAVATILKK